MNLAVLNDHRVKLKENEKRDMYIDLAWKLRKTIEYERAGDSNGNYRAYYIYQWNDTGIVGFGNKKSSGDHPNCNIAEIG